MPDKTLLVGELATELDIFIKSGQTNSLLDPSDIRFRIFDSTSTEVVTETSGIKINTGHYNASSAIIPNGFPLGNNWKIQWDIVLPGGASGSFIENFSVALATLSASFGDDSAENVDTIFDRVRIDVGDPDALIFSNGFMSRTLKKAVSRINRRLGLDRVSNYPYNIYTIYLCNSIPTIVLNVNNGVISPGSDSYADILILQMEEIILQSEAVALQRMNINTAGVLGSGLIGIAGDGVSVTNVDGVSISKSVSRLSHKADMAKFNLQQITNQLNHAISDLRWRISQGIDVTIPRYLYPINRGFEC